MRASLLLGLVIGAGAGATFASAEETPGPGVRLDRSGGVTTFTAVLPGRVIGFAPARFAGGSPRIYVLVGPAPALEESADATDEASDDAPAIVPKPLPPCPAPTPLALHGLELTDPPRLELLARDLPDDVTTLEFADLDGDGQDEPLLRRPGEILVVRDGTAVALLRDPTLTALPSPVSSIREPGSPGPPRVVSAPLGSVELFGPGENGSWMRLASADLPLEARWFDGWGFWLTSRVSLVERTAERLLLATAPHPVGQQRLQASSITLAGSGETTTVEAWMRLPEPEQLLEHHFLMLDGRLLLLVTTKIAGKLDLFGEKRLRLYTFEPDRSRLGRAPVWQADSRMNLWQQAHPLLIDADADGRLDLVVGYWKGLTDDRVVLDLYRRTEEGWFEQTPETTAFDVRDADRDLLLYGADLTGDGRADLVLGTEGRLVVHAGRQPGSGGLVERKALELPELALGPSGPTTVSVDSGGGVSSSSGPGGTAEQFADLDGDGDDELLLLAPRPDALGELRVIDFAKPKAPVQNR